MYLRVYDTRDSSRQSEPSPSLFYSFTHAHRSIGYRNRNPQLLAESVTRLMYLRVYDNRDSVYDNRDNFHQPSPSPSLSYFLTHAHSTLPTPTLITITCTQVLWCLERLTRTTVSSSETTRTSLTICSPAHSVATDSVTPTPLRRVPKPYFDVGENQVMWTIRETVW